MIGASNAVNLSDQAGAMRLSYSFAIVLILFAAVVAQETKPKSRSDGKSWWEHVKVLADDNMEGRDTGSPGHKRAAAYVADQMKKDGLKPAGTDGYFQPVKFVTRKIDESQSSMSLVRDGKEEPLKLGEDANLSVRGNPAPGVEAPMVFVGYGLRVPEANYDDFAGLDLKGKVAVFMAGAPPQIPAALASHYQSGEERVKTMKSLGLVGAIGIPNPKHMDIPWSRSTLARLRPSMALVDSDMPVMFGAGFNPAHADKLFAGTGHTLDELISLNEAGKSLPSFNLPVSVKAKVKFESSEVTSQNIVGLWPGSDSKLKSEYVLLSAHVDHLGIGDPVPSDPNDRIYNGAMDNASGVAMVLDVAAKMKAANAKPKRSVLFVIVTGEEKGELGSTYFAAHPTVPAKDIVADINTDMFLPLYPLKYLIVYGLEESTLGDNVRAAAKDQDVEVIKDPEPQRNSFIRSDQYSFIKAGIPALAMKDGYINGSPEDKTFHDWLHTRYHAPSDDLYQPVDMGAAGRFEDVLMDLAERVADQPNRPAWNGDSFFKRFAK
jgi:Zn-dependent M28 family amino/carboxypeptidase